MIPHVVVDIGNTRLKWGLCAAEGSAVIDAVSLLDEPDAWTEQLAHWASRGRKSAVTQPGAFAPGSPWNWVLASVQPHRCERLENWLREQGHLVRVIRHAEQLPLVVKLPEPDKVGIDRLLDAVAAKRRLRPGEPAVLIDVGSAVTVDWLDEEHSFCGGTIFPGVRLMAQALHEHTALLPLVNIVEKEWVVPAADTIAAMQAGIFHAIAGGIERITNRLAERSEVAARMFITGGDGLLLCDTLRPTLSCVSWPTQTLEGILASAEAILE
jgi:type III pantothenate kinase